MKPKKDKKEKKFKFDEAQLLYILAGLVSVVAAGLLIWFGYQYFDGPRISVLIDPTPGDKEQQECERARVLDGVCVASKNDINPKLVAVMIDNHMDARPQSGLSEAAVVYEAPVEGNFSRFMALYPVDAKLDKVGPVRSVRPYYVDWVSEYGDMMYMHVGGSPAALEKLRIFQINNINEFYRGWYFWRSTDRYAPHNTYTSRKLWNKALKEYEDDYVSTTYSGWSFGEVDICNIISTSTQDAICANEIAVTFLPNSFDVVWQYNSSTEKYERWQAGRLHKDIDGILVTADTVIVQHVTTRVLDGVGRLGMETIGSGDAVIFARGNVFEGEWRKSSRTSRTRWFAKDEDESDEFATSLQEDSGQDEIVLQAGKIWIEVVNQRVGVEWE